MHLKIKKSLFSAFYLVDLRNSSSFVFFRKQGESQQGKRVSRIRYYVSLSSTYVSMPYEQTSFYLKVRSLSYPSNFPDYENITS